MKKRTWRISSWAGAVSALLCLAVAVGVQAEDVGKLAKAQPLEEFSGGHSVQGEPANRIYVVDTVFNHMIASELHVFDASDGKFLGLVPLSFIGFVQLSHDGKNIYVATTYYSRNTRGKRTDVVEVWDADTLSFVREIKIPNKRASSLTYDGMFQLTNDGRFALVQNATPAQSVSVVDLQKHKFVEEITATAGCWSIIPLPDTPRSFAAICGNGSLMTLALDEDGNLADQQRSKPMFPVANDPIFIAPGVLPHKLVFVSFYGNVYTADVDENGVSFEPEWSLLNDEDKADNWRPGGYNLLAVDPDSKRLYITMHPDGKEGSHKNPAAEIWVFDLKTRKRIARIPGRHALSVEIDKAGDFPRLLTIDGGNVNVYDISEPEPEYLRTIENAAEAGLQVLAQPAGAGK